MKKINYKLIINDLYKNDVITFHFDELGLRECNFNDCLKVFNDFISNLNHEVLQKYVPIMYIPAGESKKFIRKIPNLKKIKFKQRSKDQQQLIELPTLGLISNKVLYSGYSKDNLKEEYFIPIDNLIKLKNKKIYGYFKIQRDLLDEEELYSKLFYFEYHFYTM